MLGTLSDVTFATGPGNRLCFKCHHLQIIGQTTTANLGINLAVGLAVGEFELVIERETVRNLAGDSGAHVVEAGNVKTFPVFPMIDLWFRL